MTTSEGGTRDDGIVRTTCPEAKRSFPRQGSFETTNPIATSRFTENEVVQAIRKMSRQAATAIDSWTKDMLLTMINVDKEITSLLGGTLHFILASHGPAENEGGRPFSNAVMDIVRAGRLVGIPKGEHDLRPIVISSSLAKLLGTVVLTKCGSKCSVRPRITHRTRT
jgi:hypothetical protein